MWNDLTMQQRADVISMAIKAGMRDMKSIRSFYDETSRSRRFEDGGSTKASIPILSSTPKLKFDAPVIEKVRPEYEEIKPKEEIPIEPIKTKEPIIPGLSPQQPISDSRFSRSHPIFKDEYDYMNSDAFLTRVKKMTNDNENARILATNMRERLYNTYLPNKPAFEYTSNSFNSVAKMSGDVPSAFHIHYGRYNDVPGNTTRGVIAHELGHSVYGWNKYSSLLDYHLLSPQYTSVLQRGRHKTPVSDETRRHDHMDGERIADIRALQQLAKDAGIWDKTTGVDMTPESFNKLKQTYPDNRSFDMWNDEDLRWLINTTAQNNTPILDDSNRNYLLANGGHLYAGGGHMFDGKSEPINVLYKPKENVVHRVTRVNGDLVGMDPDTGKFYDNTTGNYIGDHVALEDTVITPQNGTIDDMGNIYQNIGGVTHMTTSDGRHIILGEKPVSNVDPVGEFYVEGTALSPLFKPMERVVSGILGAPEIVKSGKEILSNAFRRGSKKEIADLSRITSENAASMTPKQWTAAQDAAIARGDMAEAQRLRDLHFKVSAPKTEVVDINGNPQLVVHKTPNTFTVFDNNRSIGKLNWFATPNAYGKNGVFATGAGKNPRTMKLYVNMRNAHKPTIDEGIEPAYINQGEDGILGIVDKGMTNYFNSSRDAGKGFMMSGGVDNPNALKSADAVTFDNKGVRIPLGERDNFNINDIRYGLLPFGIGLTGLGLVNGK